MERRIPEGRAVCSLRERFSMSRTRQTVGFVILVALCFGAAALGSAVTRPRIDGWYAALAKPSWGPPNWVFGPVWTALYLTMAVAAWIVWRQKGWAGGRVPLALFGIQLALNAAWSWLFFGLCSAGLSFVDVILLWIAIAMTVVAFWQRSMLAGLILVPYLAWVGFAAVLNGSIWQMNKDRPAETKQELPADSRTVGISKADAISPDDAFRKLAVGKWQDEYQGKRTLTLLEDGTGTMVVELSGLQATLAGPKLIFNMEWSVANGRLKKHSLSGEPATQVNMILKTMGDTADEEILELTEDRLLLLDQNGKTKYDWRRAK
jgi:tryptophan-rich sensory protein